MNRFLTRDRVVSSLIDGVVVGGVIFLLDVFLSKRSPSGSIGYAVVFGAIAFVIRLFTRPNRMVKGS